jgi:hypothetical protein
VSLENAMASPEVHLTSAMVRGLHRIRARLV